MPVELPRTKKRAEPKHGLGTKLVRGGLNRSSYGETAEGLFLTSGFVYDSAGAAERRFTGDEPGFMYSRYANPTLEVFEKRMAELDGAEMCFGTSSGMSAVFASLMCYLKTGDHLVASRALFGSCFYIFTNLLPRYGIEATLVDGKDLDAWRKAIRPNTKVCFIETPANPTLEIIDIQAVADIAHDAGAKLFIDNVFATPLLQRPFELGADVVIYSATKHIDGQGRCLGGAILSDAAYCTDLLQPFLRHTGPALSPFNAWILAKGLETLEVRLDRQVQSAAKIAAALEKHPAIGKVLYPFLDSFPQKDLARKQMSGGGTLVTFELASGLGVGRDAAFGFMDALEVIDISNNLGDSKSMVTHPMTTTHRAMPEEARRDMGITDGLVRLSVGLESVEDLIADLTQALDGVKDGVHTSRQAAGE